MNRPSHHLHLLILRGIRGIVGAPLALCSAFLLLAAPGHPGTPSSSAPSAYVYPNPVPLGLTPLLQVYSGPAKADAHVSFRVYNAAGELVLNGEGEGRELHLKTAALGPGVYFGVARMDDTARAKFRFTVTP